MIWKFNETNSYLLGSVHVMNEDANFYSISVGEIYNKVKRVVFESPLDFGSHPILFFQNDKLSNNISKTLFRDVKKRWLTYKLPYRELEKSKIWRAALMISFKIFERNGLFAKNGVDRIVLEKAKEDKIKIDYLETPEDSLSYFESTPIEEQIRFLSQAARNKSKVINEIDDILKSWKTADEEKLSSLLRSYLEEFPFLYKGIIIERNKLWVDHFISTLKSRIPTLYVVGTLHCVGQSRIQNLLLEKSGYTSTIINN